MSNLRNGELENHAQKMYLLQHNNRRIRIRRISSQKRQMLFLLQRKTHKKTGGTKKMKTTIQVTVETKDTYPVLYEAGDVESEYDTQQKKNLPSFRRKYAKELHKAFIKAIKHVVSPEEIEERFLEWEGEEVYVEGWDDLKAYGIKIKIKEVKL